MSNTVHIYGPQFSNFVRNVQLVCEEKSIPYTLGFDVNGEQVEFKGSQHEQWHPYKKVPVLFHGDAVLCETASICRYLDSQFPGVALQSDVAAVSAEIDQWCQLVTIYIDKAIVRDYLLEIVFPKGEGSKIRTDVLDNNRPELVRALQALTRQLGDKTFLVGDNFSLADIMVAPILHYVRVILTDDTLLHPDSTLGQYVHRLEARAASKNVFVPPSF